MAGGPLAATLRRLDAADEHYEFRAGEPDDDRWYRLDRVLDDAALLDAWHRDVLDGEARGRRDVAGSYLASWLTGIAVDPAVTALSTERRTWPLTAANLAVRRHHDGWFDGLAVRDASVRVLHSDTDAAHPDAIVVDGLGQLRASLVDDVVALATPVFAAVRARAPFGLRGMWGALGDDLASTLVRRAEDRGGDVDDAWAETVALLDLLADAAPVPLARPRLDRVGWRGGTAAFTVKGTCCLFYKTIDGTPDLNGDDYCTSCPLRDDEWRRRRWSARMEERATSGKGL